MEQLQAGGPTAGTPGQRSRRFGGQRLPEHRDEELLHLPGAEPQVVIGDLLQLPGNPQPGDVHLRLPTRTDQHPQGVRPQFDELLQDALRRRTGDLMQVVQDQDRAVARPALQRLEQGAHGRFGFFDPQAVPQRPTEMGDQRGNGRVVPRHPVPGDRNRGCRSHSRQQRGLSRPRRRDHQIEPAGGAVQQWRLQPFAGQAGRLRSPQLLGQDDWCAHRAARLVHIGADIGAQCVVIVRQGARIGGGRQCVAQG